MNNALTFLASHATGPNGGNLNNPAQQPERRRQPLNVEMKENGPGLHRGLEFKDSAVAGLGNEQPWHRMAAFMLLAGRTNSEIGMAAGVGANMVSILRGQRWFQELLAVLANETGADITGLLASEAQASLNKLVELRDNAESERIQMSAALALLEHANGKPTQKIISSVSHTTHSSPSEEMDSINQQLAALRSSATRELKAPVLEKSC